MPWELTVRRFEGSPPAVLPGTGDPCIPVGSVADVQATLERVLPGLKCYEEPSGLEKLRLMREAGVSEIPAVIVKNLEAAPSSFAAEYEGPGFSITILLGSKQIVEEVALEVRGHGDPSAILGHLAEVPSWALYDRASGARLLGSAVSGPWESFKRYVTRGVEASGSGPIRRGGV